MSDWTEIWRYFRHQPVYFQLLLSRKRPSQNRTSVSLEVLSTWLSSTVHSVRKTTRLILNRLLEMLLPFMNYYSLLFIVRIICFHTLCNTFSWPRNPTCVTHASFDFPQKLATINFCKYFKAKSIFLYAYRALLVLIICMYQQTHIYIYIYIYIYQNIKLCYKTSYIVGRFCTIFRELNQQK
jgi:hypothetical protein